MTKICLEIGSKETAKDLINRILYPDSAECGMEWEQIDDVIKNICLEIGKPFGITEEEITKENFGDECDDI